MSVDISANVRDLWKVAGRKPLDVLSVADGKVTADTLAADETVSHIAWSNRWDWDLFTQASSE